MKLLYLVHRLPYPPNKGDKISSFNILRHFSKRHDVYLGTFVDSADDWQHVDTVRGYCRELCVRELDPLSSKLRSLTGLLTGDPLSNVYYRDGELQTWVHRTLRNVRPNSVLMYSGCMGQYVYGASLASARTIFEPEDVDSEKWSKYAATKAWPFSWLYAREARKLRLYERRMARSFDATVFISSAEAELFKSICPEAAARVTFRTQGVDVDYFDPGLPHANPYAPSERALVFVGAMDYWPNVQAVTWFSKEIFPRILQHRRDARFYIVGTSPTQQVKRLGNEEGVVVTGGVPDVRPYLQHSWAVCLPLSIARGIQNKALEAMAMGKRVLASPEAASGIKTSDTYEMAILTTPEEWVSSALAILSADRANDSVARDFVKRNYGWDANLRRFEETVFAEQASLRD